MGGFAFGMLMGECSGIVVAWVADGIGGTVLGDREEEIESKTGNCLFDLALGVKGAGGG